MEFRYTPQNSKETETERKFSLIFQRIRSNHGKDTKDLAVVQTKYNDLKKKVRQYQRHVKNKESHYLGEIDRLQDLFGGILKSYKNKVDTAYQSKEKMVSE